MEFGGTVDNSPRALTCVALLIARDAAQTVGSKSWTRSIRNSPIRSLNPGALYTQASGKAALMMLVLHEMRKRMDLNVIRMKNEWNRLFGFDK